jgi:major type 1 subunit fimbrin (pilin)
MKRKVIAVLTTAALGLGMASSALATGTLHFKGNIYDTVCTVSVNDAGNGQAATVNMGTFATGDMRDGANLPGTTFNIKVADCPQGAVDHTTITMNGFKWSDGSNTFVITELGGGLGILIKDTASNSIIEPNVTYPLSVIANAEKQFNYKADLHVASASAVKAGNISTTLTINVAME